MHRYRRLIRYTLRQWRSLVCILGLTAATAFVTTLQPWPMKLLVDHALGPAAVPALIRSVHESFSIAPTPPVLVVTAALASLGLFALYSALDVGLSWAWAAAGQRMVHDLAWDLFHRLQHLSLMFHKRRTVGDSLSRLTGDTWCVYTLTDSLLVSPGRHLITLATVGAVGWSLDPGLTAVSLGTALALGGSARFFGRRLKRRAQQNREVQSRLMSFVHQTLTAIPVAQAFGTEERNGEHFRRLAVDAVALSQRGTLLKSAYGLVGGLARTVASTIVLYVGGQRVLSGALSLGSLLVFLAYVRSMQGACQGLLGTYVSLKSAEASIDRVREVLEAEEIVRDAPGAQPLPLLPPRERGHVRLEHVTFGYEPNRPVLHGITLELRPGERVALVGPTGAGKSTLVSLIPRFFDPWEGRVLFDGCDVRQVRLASVRAQVALVLQEPFLLPLTVAENIAYGRPGASRAEIVAAAEAAGADAFIRQLPAGYDTVVGERGATLSGGEKQRLSIARAVLKDAPVVILDEPTSALDGGTEAAVLGALERLMAGRTTVVIAHRLSTVRWAERIVVVEGGRVVETGTHPELLAARGRYYHLCAPGSGLAVGAGAGGLNRRG